MNSCMVLTSGFCKMIWLLSIVILFSFAESIIQTCYGNNHREFLFTFLPLESVSFGRHLDIYVMISGYQTVEVRARTPIWNGHGSFDAEFKLPYGANAHLEIPSNLVVSANTIDKKSIVITSNDDIVIYYRISENDSSGMYTIIPSAYLGTDHYVITYEPASGSGDNAFVNVVPSLPGETIVNVILQGNSKVTVTINGINFSSGQMIKIYLQQYENILITSLFDLTGTRVLSSKPVSVTSGNTALSTNGGVDKDYVIEQMLPVHLWGQKHVIIPNFWTETELVRIVAASKVEITTYGGINFTLNAGEFYDFEISPGTTAIDLTSSSPVTVGHFTFLHHNTEGSHADATFTVIPQVNMFSNRYVFIAPNPIRNISYEWTLIALFQQGSQDLLLDRQPISEDRITWVDIPIPQYRYGRVTSQAFTLDVHYMTSPSDVFGGFIHGHCVVHNDSVSMSLGAIGKSTERWIRQNDIYTTRFSSYLDNRLPYETPMEESVVKSTNGCHRICTENVKCSFVAVKKFDGLKICKFYDSHLPCKAMFQEDGYKLYQRHFE